MRTTDDNNEMLAEEHGGAATTHASYALFFLDSWPDLGRVYLFILLFYMYAPY